ncbi:hypothetical protein WJ85_27945 [Burkholderia ubonensis]|uniref:hypothetical protein n=1 Tax=Burkholderia ubonensis TaxID=101571 RepID=UPI00075649C9|nr:hypothetical protein [Burkholderia ubonensis]KVO12614.1 hypothetical protein WJ74_15260 [Burkholderia ubonensis]KVP31683.1 hypothetical protein WJ85_27945 [Burkholderia ubonensis]KWB95241.1 hypothetical protein WL44_05950 [Burkholderia ubonensis]
MGKSASRRTGRAALTKAQLLPLSTEKIRALSLENHLALSVVRAGAGDFEQMSCLLRAVYLAYFMRNETAAGMDADVYRRAEMVMDRCIGRVERGETWALESNEVAELERVLVLHDEQLAAVPLHRYQSAWERLQRFITSGQRSPIPAAATA